LGQRSSTLPTDNVFNQPNYLAREKEVFEMNRRRFAASNP
jgi:hypothetical protein